MARLHVIDQPPRSAALWATARGLAMLGVVLLLVGLVRWPEAALLILWNVLVPILPATFFLTTALWRGLCPLATLNEWGNALGQAREVAPATLRFFRVGGLLLFYILVPARHVYFNVDGPALATVIVLVALIALSIGGLFPVRSAWCNALCPVLPVELLYGQAPLVTVTRGRCPSCTVCTPSGCLDLAGDKTLAQLLGPSRRTFDWLLTPLGVFFAALPGFIVGYNTVGDGGIRTAPAIYGTVLASAAASFIAAAAIVILFRLNAKKALPVLAALAGGIYYWFAGPSIAQHFGVGAPVALTIRGLGIGIVVWWVVTLAPRRNRSSAGSI